MLLLHAAIDAWIIYGMPLIGFDFADVQTAIAAKETCIEQLMITSTTLIWMWSLSCAGNRCRYR